MCRDGPRIWCIYKRGLPFLASVGKNVPNTIETWDQGKGNARGGGRMGSARFPSAAPKIRWVFPRSQSHLWSCSFRKSLLKVDFLDEPSSRSTPLLVAKFIWFTQPESRKASSVFRVSACDSDSWMILFQLKIVYIPQSSVSSFINGSTMASKSKRRADVIAQLYWKAVQV